VLPDEVRTRIRLDGSSWRDGLSTTPGGEDDVPRPGAFTPPNVLRFCSPPKQPVENWSHID
jgi:hypothetical protein